MIDFEQHYSHELQLALERFPLLNNLPGFDALYLNSCEEVMNQPSSNKLPDLWLIVGRSAAAKDGIIRSLKKLDQVYKPLIRWARARNLGIRQWEVPFSTSMLAAQAIGKIPKTLVEENGGARYEIRHRAYTSKEYQAGPKIMKEAIRYGIQHLRSPDRLVIQPSTLTSKVVQGKWRVKNDRGDSVFQWLAQKPKLRERLYVVAALRDNIRVLPEALEFRQALAQANVDNIEELLASKNMRIHLRTKGMKSAKHKNFTKRECLLLATVLPQMMAPAASMVRSDQEQDQVIEELFQANIISEPTEKAYYNHFKEAWDIPDDHWLVTPNQWMGDAVDYYYDENGFMGGNLIVKLHPRLKEVYSLIMYPKPRTE